MHRPGMMGNESATGVAKVVRISSQQCSKYRAMSELFDLPKSLIVQAPCKHMVSNLFDLISGEGMRNGGKVANR